MEYLQCRKTYMTAPGMRMTLTVILRDVCKKLGVGHETMRGLTRERRVVDARYIFFYRARVMTGASLYRIGKMVLRDHSTVIYGLSQVEDVREIREKYESLYGKIVSLQDVERNRN